MKETHENQIDLADLSSINVNGHEETGRKTDGILHMLNDINSEESSKSKYLKFLNEKNRSLQEEIKSLGRVLDDQIAKLKKKGYLDISKITHKKRNPRVKVARSIQLQEAYEELNRIKLEVEAKKLKQEGISFLVNKYRQLKAELKIKYEELQLKERTYNELLKKQKAFETSIIEPPSNITLLQNHTEELKVKIKQQSERVYKEKQQFINNNKPKKQNKYRNNSTLQLKHQEDNQDDEEIRLSPRALGLRDEYEAMGRKIQLLKMKKVALLGTEDDIESKRKYLKQLKIKLKKLQKMKK